MPFKFKKGSVFLCANLNIWVLMLLTLHKLNPTTECKVRNIDLFTVLCLPWQQNVLWMGQELLWVSTKKQHSFLWCFSPFQKDLSTFLITFVCQVAFWWRWSYSIKILNIVLHIYFQIQPPKIYGNKYFPHLLPDPVKIIRAID